MQPYTINMRNRSLVVERDKFYPLHFETASAQSFETGLSAMILKVI